MAQDKSKFTYEYFDHIFIRYKVEGEPKGVDMKTWCDMLDEPWDSSSKLSSLSEDMQKQVPC